MESPTYSEYFSLIIEGATRRRLAMAGPSTPPASPPSRDGETEGAGAKEHISAFPPRGKTQTEIHLFISHVFAQPIKGIGGT